MWGPGWRGVRFKSLLHVTDIFPILYVNAVLSISSVQKIPVENGKKVQGLRFSQIESVFTVQMVLGPMTEHGFEWLWGF